jgi:hypothetical protein
MKKIVIIGRSNKIIAIIKGLFKKCNLEVISWRKLGNCVASTIKKQKNPQPNLIVICGYDYESYFYSFERYYEANVTNPIKLIERITKKNTKILYINTSIDNNKKTFSRYRFAKIELAFKLKSRYKNFRMISPELIMGKSGLEIHGGIISKLLLKIMISLSILTTTNSNELQNLIGNKIKETKQQPNIERLEPCFLKLRRNQFVDRFLRMAFG